MDSAGTTTQFRTAAEAGTAVEYDIIGSPVGRLLVAWDQPAGQEQALTGLYLYDGGRHTTSLRPNWTLREGGYREAARQLAEYFAGMRTGFDLPLAPRGSEFQLAVWEQLTRIPFGATTSYGEVALALGKSPVASRAVGLANGKNPISIIVPCHRVIGADGSMTGYGGGIERKEWLLRHEGAIPAAMADTLW
ncbi:MAG TPA: methylated-DNA--[protein]-cysteine S-methyltransferase [Trebonia sp.]|jgi:methylated-DNA-[protein]-cysteine S-methyltransferase|nr:methylated-DNA--[protein]-cysteine S-methyltransferase [Trebonia sp.]